MSRQSLHASIRRRASRAIDHYHEAVTALERDDLSPPERSRLLGLLPHLEKEAAAAQESLSAIEAMEQ